MRTLLSLLMLVSLSAMGQSAAKPAEASAWKTYTDPQYSVDYPADWTLKEPDTNSPYLFFLSARLSADDKFTENVNILHQYAEGQTIAIDTLVSASVAQIKAMLTNAEFLENKRLSIKGGELHKIVYKGDMGVFHLQFEQYYVSTGSHVYVITFSSEQDQYEKYRAAAERILNSFQLKG